MPKVNTLKIDPHPLYELSPWLYMQFMEPLGTTDNSVEAAWDHGTQKWREDVIKTTRELAPPLIRWGGIYSAYSHWREAVGLRDKRVPVFNIIWGGMETSQIGTGEFVEFCEEVGAEPFFCVNFMSDGRPKWSKYPDGSPRIGYSQEAAEWVDYCNNPDNAERIAHGRRKPYNLKLWQIGNETSYFTNPEDGIPCEEAARRTVQFAQAMRKADPSLSLIGWGDSGWAAKMLDIAGEHLQYIAFHVHYGGPSPGVLKNNDYRKDWSQTWEQLMDSCNVWDNKINEMRREISGYDIKLALTEGHFALPGRTRCEVLSSWAAGVANARMLNVFARHGDVLKIATLADFCGNRWMNNAIYVQTPGNISYMMPVAQVTSLFSRHTGSHAVSFTGETDGLDITVSRKADRFYLHAANTNMTRDIPVSFEIDGYNIESGAVYELCKEPEWEIMHTNYKELAVKETPLGENNAWCFPAASVSAVELNVKKAKD